jgi:RNA polymerase-binding transcription factor DksA
MNTFHYKDILIREQDKLIEAMSTIGQMTQQIDGDWVVHTEHTDEHEANLLANKMDEIETNEGVLGTLEERLKEVVDALDRLENNTFGVCQKCGKQIEVERLEANSAAKTCITCL